MLTRMMSLLWSGCFGYLGQAAAVLLTQIMTAAGVAATESAEPLITWSDWQLLDKPKVSYLSIDRTETGMELWFSARIDQDRDAIIGLSGPSLLALQAEPQHVLTSEVIAGYEQHKPKRQFPIISRAAVTRLPDGQFLALAAIGPSYQGGASELYPALFLGAGKTWRHLGPPAGDLEQILATMREKKKKIRTDGGSVIVLPDGRLRMYLNGFGRRLMALEADQPAGPWTIVRAADGSILEITPQQFGGAWLFTHVIAVPGRGYLLTGGNAWPPKALYAALSEDGLDFSHSQAHQPVLLPGDIKSDAPSMKVLRCVWDPTQNQLLAVTNIWDPDEKNYRLYAGSGRLRAE